MTTTFDALHADVMRLLRRVEELKDGSALAQAQAALETRQDTLEKAFAMLHDRIDELPQVLEDALRRVARPDA